MKKTNLKATILCMGLLAMFITSCNSEKSAENNDFSGKDSTDIVVDNIIVDSAVTDNSERSTEQERAKSAPLFSKGDIWKLWQRLHKECMKNEFFKNPTYLGISNTTDLGSIFTKNDQLAWDFDRLFTQEERNSVIRFGSSKSCDYREEIRMNLEGLIETSLDPAGAEAELSTAIENQKNITAKINQWQIDRLITKEFKYLISHSSNPKVKEFKSTFENEDVRILTQVARIIDFSSVIYLDEDISTSLSAALKKGITKPVGDSEAKIKFSYKSDREISVTSSGSFIVFAEFTDAKKLRN
ncbi:MAG: hypothetical protein K2Q33_03545 [Gammaproteobacteria bacterium]|nr:hypothetical protein [Gammaproteobacteria bacterium]